MLASLIETCAVHLESEGRSPKTLEWHRACLSKFQTWLQETGNPESPGDWNAALIRAHFVALKHMSKHDGSRLSATSINTSARSLRVFCYWLHAEEFCDWNVIGRVKPPTAPKLVKPELTPLLSGYWKTGTRRQTGTHWNGSLMPLA